MAGGLGLAVVPGLALGPAATPCPVGLVVPRIMPTALPRTARNPTATTTASTGDRRGASSWVILYSWFNIVWVGCLPAAAATGSMTSGRQRSTGRCDHVSPARREVAWK